MANATYTLANLVGTGGTMSLVSQDEPVDRQLFGFPGINGVYSTTLGARGPVYVAQGRLRASGANAAATGLAMTAVIDNLKTIHRNGTIFDLFHGESSTNIYKLYVDGSGIDMKNLIIQELRLTSPRYFADGGLTENVDYEMTLLRVGP